MTELYSDVVYRARYSEELHSAIAAGDPEAVRREASARGFSSEEVAQLNMVLLQRLQRQLDRTPAGTLMGD